MTDTPIELVERLHDHARHVGGDPSFERLYGDEAEKIADLIKAQQAEIASLREGITHEELIRRMRAANMFAPSIDAVFQWARNGVLPLALEGESAKGDFALSQSPHLTGENNDQA